MCIRDSRYCDAEGLAVHDGIAYVSFERQHRIEKYSFNSSGVPAEGKLIKRISNDFEISGSKISKNGSLEALNVDKNGTIFTSWENAIGSSAMDKYHPQIAIKDDNLVLKPKRIKSFGPEFGLVGSSKNFRLYRHHDKAKEIIIHAHRYDRTLRIEKVCNPDCNIDNFEGIAEYSAKDGNLYFYIISDDNPQNRHRPDYNQRTLLYLFKFEIPETFRLGASEIQ